MNPSLQVPGTSHRQMYVMIYGSVRAGFRDCLFQAIIVCEPAPTSTRYILIYAWVGAAFRNCQLLANIVGETRPYQITFTKLATC
ncbi:hypothetical protein [Microcoleus sp. F4-D5]|uniref:hypothetical protein n=1 Tax=Microcoleus sp. F4-D5 TaxID=2818760 RepID=UPI002FD5F26C